MREITGAQSRLWPRNRGRIKRERRRARSSGSHDKPVFPRASVRPRAYGWASRLRARPRIRADGSDVRAPPPAVITTNTSNQHLDMSGGKSSGHPLKRGIGRMAGTSGGGSPKVGRMRASSARRICWSRKRGRRRRQCLRGRAHAGPHEPVQRPECVPPRRRHAPRQWRKEGRHPLPKPATTSRHRPTRLGRN